MLIANLPELGKLNRQEIAALAGLAPWDRSSGKYDGKAHIFGGRKDVRSVLYMAAFTAGAVIPLYVDLPIVFNKKGKAYKVVITACMRKLLIILNTMIRNQTLWTPKISKKILEIKHSRFVPWCLRDKNSKKIEIKTQNKTQ